jgi:hypothetical protein
MLYASTDGALSLTKLAVPKGTILAYAVSPAAPKTIALVMTDETLFLTKDGGVTWNQGPLPILGTAGGFQGMTFDASGDLYALRGSTLFRSRP